MIVKGQTYLNKSTAKSSFKACMTFCSEPAWKVWKGWHTCCKKTFEI